MWQGSDTGFPGPAGSSAGSDLEKYWDLSRHKKDKTCGIKKRLRWLVLITGSSLAEAFWRVSLEPPACQNITQLGNEVKKLQRKISAQQWELSIWSHLRTILIREGWKREEEMRRGTKERRKGERGCWGEKEIFYVVIHNLSNLYAEI